MKWARAHEANRRGRQVSEDKEAFFLDRRTLNQDSNAFDIRWLQELLQNDLHEFHREKILASIEWLQGASTRTLGPSDATTGWRGYYRRLAAVLAKGQYGRELLPEDD